LTPSSMVGVAFCIKKGAPKRYGQSGWLPAAVGAA
jgi:hypothetical protein